MARNLDEPGADFNQLLELSIKLQNARTFAGTKVAYNWQEGDWTDPDDESVGYTKILEDFEITDEMRRKPNAAGGRVGLASGANPIEEEKTVLPKAKPKDYAGTLKMLLSKEAWNTLDPRTWTDLTFDFAKKAREAGQISDKTYQSLMMPLFGEKGEKITKAITKHDELNEGGRVGFTKGSITPSESWMRDYFFSGKGGYDDRMSFPEFQIGPGIDLWHRFGKSN